MPPQDPKPGQVIQYGYLFRSEHERGIEYGKDRPCLIRAVRQDPEQGTTVFLHPITTTPQKDHDRCIPLPSAVSRHLGLDNTRQSYLLLGEINRAEWPSPEARNVPAGRGKPERDSYGFMPQKMFKQALQRGQALAQVGRVLLVDRDFHARQPVDDGQKNTSQDRSAAERKDLGRDRD